MDAVIYQLLIEAEGADGLDIEQGREVSFLWKRKDKFYISESAETWEQGVVYWDACSSQDCTFHVDEDGNLKEKYLKLFVQHVKPGADGFLSDFGSTIACGFIELSQFVKDTYRGEDVFDRVQKMTIPLRPCGKVNLKISCGPAITEQPEEESIESEDCFVPSFEIVDGHKNGTPLLKRLRELSVEESALLTGEYYSSPSESLSSSAVNSTTCGEGGNDTESNLQRKIARLTRQCEEARARAFSEASVALQRGIEIDNLKRAKDVLMKRLESTEQQLMAMMKQDFQMGADRNSAGGSPSEGAPDVHASLIHALAETKVALAEKEFEAMELHGQLKAKEAHIEALTLHLAAIRESASKHSTECSAVISPKTAEQQEQEISVDAKREEMGPKVFAIQVNAA